jgi:hypothetical protein
MMEHWKNIDHKENIIYYMEYNIVSLSYTKDDNYYGLSNIIQKYKPRII